MPGRLLLRGRDSYAFLSILFCTDNSNKLIELLNEKDEIPEWNDPEICGA